MCKQTFSELVAALSKKAAEIDAAVADATATREKFCWRKLYL